MLGGDGAMGRSGRGFGDGVLDCSSSMRRWRLCVVCSHDARSLARRYGGIQVTSAVAYD
jgi:hypothetical protein